MLPGQLNLTLRDPALSISITKWKDRVNLEAAGQKFCGILVIMVRTIRLSKS